MTPVTPGGLKDIARKGPTVAALALLGGLAGGLLTGCGLGGLSGAATGPVTIATENVHLDAGDSGQLSVGVLQYQGGLMLSSNVGAFGGLSGLTLSPMGDRIIALTDQGDLFQARLVHNKAGWLEGLSEPTFHRLRGADSKHLTRRPDKRDQDAEAIGRLADGSYLVSFEHRHRIMHYKTLTGRPTLFAMPPGLDQAPRNGGLEALTALPDGRILVMTEKLRVGDSGSGGSGGNTKKNAGAYIGWLLDANGKSLGEVYWPGLGIFRPTDLAALPNGDVLLLQRRYSVAGGPGMRLSLIPAARIKPGAQLLDIELAQLSLPQAVDNFEGLAAFPAKAGGWTIYILSDDNFNPLQRNLLLQFHLSE